MGAVEAYRREAKFQYDIQPSTLYHHSFSTVPRAKLLEVSHKLPALNRETQCLHF